MADTAVKFAVLGICIALALNLVPAAHAKRATVSGTATSPVDRDTVEDVALQDYISSIANGDQTFNTPVDEAGAFIPTFRRSRRNGKPMMPRALIQHFTVNNNNAYKTGFAYVSHAGGTLVTIVGSGFARGGVEGQTSVYACKNDPGAHDEPTVKATACTGTTKWPKATCAHPIPCDVIVYYSSDTQLICRTRPTPRPRTYREWSEDRYELRVRQEPTFNTGEVPQWAESNCPVIAYNQYVTPMIHTHSYTLRATEALEFGGRLFGPWQHSLIENIDVKFGNKNFQLQCPVVSEATGTTTATALDNEDQTPATFAGVTAPGHTNVNHCQLPKEPMAAGHYNLSVSCHNRNENRYRDNYAYGAPTFDRWDHGAHHFDMADGTRANGDDVYHTVVVPEILSLSGHVSGLRGGQTVAIDGTGFDTTCTNNKVTLAGRPCAVATCSPTRVTCVVGENTQNLDDVTRKGTKGMQWLAVKDVHGQSHNAERLVAQGKRALSFAHQGFAPDAQWVESGYFGARNHGHKNGDAFLGTLIEHGGLYLAEGYFVPRHTGKHSFYMNADDTGVFMLSSNLSDDTSLQVVASREHRRVESQFHPEEAMSSGSVHVHLEKGGRYAYQAFLRDQGGQEALMMSVRVHDLPNRTWAEAQYHTPQENILIAIASTAQPHVQQLVVKGATKGTFQLKGFATHSVDLGASDSTMKEQMKNAVVASLQEVTGAHPQFAWWYGRKCTSGHIKVDAERRGKAHAFTALDNATVAVTVCKDPAGGFCPAGEECVCHADCYGNHGAKVWAKNGQSNTNYITSKWCTSGFEMCFVPGTLGTGAKTRLETSIKKF